MYNNYTFIPILEIFTFTHNVCGPVFLVINWFQTLIVVLLRYVIHNVKYDHLHFGNKI